MQRSTFIGFAATASALAAIGTHRSDVFGHAGANPERDSNKYSRVPSQAGRCFASRKTTRWSGYTLDELDA